MFLSVIIPTRNRAKYLAGALASITGQTYPQELFEVIVVDNGSTDNTKEVCESFNDRIKNLRYFYEPTPGLHVGRHLGMRQAKAEILVYADDDIEAFPTWLEAIAESFQNPEVVLVGGKNLPKWEAEPPDWILKMWEKDKNGNRILEYLSIIDLGDEKKFINPFYVFGCNFSIKKKILQEFGGFHPDGMPEDLLRYRGDGETYVCRSIYERGYISLYNPRASIFHVISKNRLNDKYFYRRAFREGISYSFSFIRKRARESNSTISSIYLPLFLKYLVLICKAFHIDKRKFFINISYLGGFFYHSSLFLTNDSVKNWVMADTYIERKMTGIS
ncbi:MAG: glycosyltransferase family 2 protein [Candidatus Bathyarchaeia archaeon]|nr:glycosyltransferase family 2 protein [Candidatus Jingweiarchaeum tengchongense]